MFEVIPTYDKYRTLSLKKPQLKGEDVYALQCALTSLGFDVGGSDGILGVMTDRGIREAQKYCNLIVDGAAGGKTQTALAAGIVVYVSSARQVPNEILRGQLEHESGFRLGIYSPARPDGHFDVGVAQRNTKFTPARDGFNPSFSIFALADNVRNHYNLFSGIKLDHRRWMLAQGAWNAPAFACYIAREEGASKVTTAMTLRPSSASRATLEEYMTKVSKYL